MYRYVLYFMKMYKISMEKTVKLKINTLSTFEIISYWILSPIEAYMMRNNVRCIRSTLKSVL